MFKPRISPRLRRLAATVGATMLIGSALAGSVAAKGVEDVDFPPPFAGGWYGSEVFGDIVFDVDPATATYRERIADVNCSGPGTDFSSPALPRMSDVNIGVTVWASSPTTAGTTISCTAIYEQDFAFCAPFIGCIFQGFWSLAGTETASATVKVDLSGPSAFAQPSSSPNANGWYRTAGTVDWAGFDPLSGIYDCASDEPFGGTDTVEGVVHGGCRNNAGIIRADEFHYQFDGTAPELAPTVSPNPVGLNSAATASPNATDNLSGIDTASCGAVDTSTVGTHSVSCQATDEAGNTTTESVDYTVAYTFAGFDAPVDTAAINVAKAGRAIPLKWRVTDGLGNPVTDLASVAVRATALACDLGDTADLLEEYASGQSGLQNLGNGYYQFNWSTPKSYASSCKTLSVDLGDDIEHTAEFRFVK